MFEEDGPAAWEDEDIVTVCWMGGHGQTWRQNRKCMKNVPVSNQMGAAIHLQVRFSGSRAQRLRRHRG
jgi:hypothetical protein